MNINNGDGIKTEVLPFSDVGTAVRKRSIRRASEILKSGGLVAYPTETVYGLAARIYDPHQVKKIYQVKERPKDKPLLVAVSGVDMVSEVAQQIPDAADFLMRQMWPGPVSIILRRKNSVPPVAVSGGDTVGLRCPDHTAFRELLRVLEEPITSPSANISGEPSPRSAGEVAEQLEGRIDAIIDGGPLPGGASTLVDLTGVYPEVLRRGNMGYEIVQALVDNVDDAQDKKPTVLVVCTGNTCRSPVAESILANELKPNFGVKSAGISASSHSRATKEAVDVVREKGYDISQHRSQPLEDVDWSDVRLVVTMTQMHAVRVREYLKRCEKDNIPVMRLGDLVEDEDLEMDVPDPFGGDMRQYKQMFEKIKKMISSALDEIIDILSEGRSTNE